MFMRTLNTYKKSYYTCTMYLQYCFHWFTFFTYSNVNNFEITLYLLKINLNFFLIVIYTILLVVYNDMIIIMK